MSQETGERHPICLCSEDICQCAIGVLRDNRLQALLLASQEDVSNGRLRFFPRESVVREISPAFIYKVLQKFAGTGDNITADVQEATNRVIPRGSCYCRKSLCTRNRVIFASLLFAGLHDILVHFFDAAPSKSCDSSLWKLSQENIEFGDDDTIFRRIQDLEAAQKQLFLYWRHQLQAMCFLKTEDENEIKKLGPEDGVEDSMCLPWTSVERPGIRLPATASTGTLIIDMSSAKVEKACIQQSHHTLDLPTNCVALKMFKVSDLRLSKKDFDHELMINNKLPRGDRIVALLAAFQYRGTLYLMFPWAELGDLRAIWQGYSSQPPKVTGQQIRHAEWYTPEWLLEECLGIASAVAEIHESPDILGAPMLNAMSYRAPEYDVQDTVTIKYDVWSLGCVFLEFITWALKGCNGVIEFSDKRIREEKDPRANFESLSEDTFFKRVAGRRGHLSWPKIFDVDMESLDGSFTRQRKFGLPKVNRRIVTQIREPVSTHLQELSSTLSSEDGIQQLLGVIKDHMLVIDPKKRASSGEVQRMVSNMIKKPRARSQHD
ncbi:uncharacterized protein PG998_009231 [Apiospora kogelbergensis]|uniref:uncharacterized protein n=1 Tax=Apiospora kogelbergensis TaxID=1337665 RepID=UPI00312F8A67